jgi:large subunit ribosomal protein L7/L12
MADQQDSAEQQNEQNTTPEEQAPEVSDSAEAMTDKAEATVEAVANDAPKAEEAKAEPAKEEKKQEKKVDASKLSDKAKKVLDMVSEMTVLELAELVKVLEDKFGVSAAPVAVAAAGGVVAGAAAVEEKSEYNINLVDAGSNKIGVIKAIREVTELGLKEAKDLVESAPKMVREGVKKAEAEEIKKKLEAAGAKAELV